MLSGPGPGVSLALTPAKFFHGLAVTTEPGFGRPISSSFDTFFALKKAVTRADINV
jgi:hypothetical protein